MASTPQERSIRATVAPVPSVSSAGARVFSIRNLDRSCSDIANVLSDCQPRGESLAGTLQCPHFDHRPVAATSARHVHVCAHSATVVVRARWPIGSEGHGVRRPDEWVGFFSLDGSLIVARIGSSAAEASGCKPGDSVVVRRR